MPPDYINEFWPFENEPMEPSTFDKMMEKGWRMLGTYFLRQNMTSWQGQPCNILPLRIRLDGFQLSKSQRKALRRNLDLTIQISSIHLTKQKDELFKKHTSRFIENIPDTVFSFLNNYSHKLPVSGLEINLFDDSKLICCSYFHIGDQSVNSTYCFFDPDYSHRSLGTFTLLLELLYAKQMNHQYYYLGYAYDVPSQFDYKKNFNNLEVMDWETNEWKTLNRVPVGSEKALKQGEF